MRTLLFMISAFIAAIPPLAASAQQFAPIPRRLPPEGIAVAPADQARLREGVAELAQRLEQARSQADAAALEPLLPDIEIYLKAVSYAVEQGEFYNPKDVAHAAELLDVANDRLDQLLAGRSPWTAQHGLVVRGYRSALDDSVQPYGLVIPEDLDLSRPVPLYVWLHGRGDKTTDLSFIYGRQSSVGTISPPDAIVLHPFGRFCNAFKFAGEVDVFEAMASVQSRYKIDSDRIILWGFSMGGAGVWHLAAHHPDRWAAASPGAGFAETARYQNIQPRDYPPAYEQNLWNLFDVPSYTRNLFNLPVIAYSGEIDKQIQAARIMEEAFAQYGHILPHLIGPGMGHRYHPDTLAELARRMHEYAVRGIDRHPKSITLQTRTLRYNRCHWLELLGLEEHWQDTRADAELLDEHHLKVATKNVAALKLTDPRPDGGGFDPGFQLEVDGTSLRVSQADRPRESVLLEKADTGWRIVRSFPSPGTLRKTPGLQGPIDDVWMEPFLVVVPTGECLDPAVERWVRFELDHFQQRWRLLFRGDARTKKDVDVTDEDMARYHLVLWGDRASNHLLARIADRLPIGWTDATITAGGQTFPAAGHVPTLIYPNPLAPSRYVVLNSGLTFREAHDRTNSLQNPKLPDWAVIDLTQPPDAQRPGRIAAAGFFDENWQWR